jgi:hypothetical protein
MPISHACDPEFTVAFFALSNLAVLHNDDGDVNTYESFLIRTRARSISAENVTTMGCSGKYSQWGNAPPRLTKSARTL